MIDWIIEFSARNKFLVLLLTAFLMLAGYWSMRSIPLSHALVLATLVLAQVACAAFSSMASSDTSREVRSTILRRKPPD